LITVLSGERPIGRLVISKELISTIESLVRDAGFKSSYISRSKLIESFSFEGGKNKWKCTPDDIEHIKNNNIYFYVSKNESDISKLIKHDEGYNIKRSGIALGYPSCCVKKYFNNIKLGKYSEQELLMSAYILSKDKNNIPFLSNYGTFGKTLLLHYPCSYDCKNSIETAKKNLSLIKKISIPFHIKTISYLKKPIFINNEVIVYFKLDNPIFNRYYNNSKFISKGIQFNLIKVNENEIIADNGDKFYGHFIKFQC
jgi:hypothetical protein